MDQGLVFKSWVFKLPNAVLVNLGTSGEGDEEQAIRTKGAAPFREEKERLLYGLGKITQAL